MPRVLATTGKPCMALGSIYYTLLLCGAKLYLCTNEAGYGERRRTQVETKDFRKPIELLVREYDV